MRKHWQYLQYVLRHKWYVMSACFDFALFRIKGHALLRLRLMFRGIVHDWTKFLPSEWFPYAENFYGEKRQFEYFTLSDKYGMPELAPWGEGIHDRFCIAWNFHQKRNDHHWQYWYLIEDDGGAFSVGVPLLQRYEMICDWIGAGHAITVGREIERRRKVDALILAKQPVPDDLKVWIEWTPHDTLKWYEANKARIKLREEDHQWVEAEIKSYIKDYDQLQKLRGMGVLV